MQIYRVGGSVRDELLGLPVHDADWVVVGATPEHMLKLGYRAVGKDFPVFLHPDTHEEYALARTERKTAPGYKGFAVHFAPDVTLADDLLRRDLTINAMARAEDGTLIDPHGGYDDLRTRFFRHVSAAFAEDPVRILRTARFAARFTDFETAPETMAMMRAMVTAGEVDALVPERVWQEVARGLMARGPARMFDLLDDCGALARLLPALSLSSRLRDALDHAARHDAPLASRFALLALASTSADPDSDPDTDADAGNALAARLRAPNDCAAIAQAALRERAHFDQEPLDAGAGAMLGWIERCDALRRPERLAMLMPAAEAWTQGRLQTFALQLLAAREAAAGIDAGAIAKPLAKAGPQAIAFALHAARIEAIEAGVFK